MKDAYQDTCMEIVDRRAWSMMEGLGLQLTPDPNYNTYYGMVDFEFWAHNDIGEEAVAYLKCNVDPLDLAFRLAEVHGTVLLNSGGSKRPTGPCRCPSPIWLKRLTPISDVAWMPWSVATETPVRPPSVQRCMRRGASTFRPSDVPFVSGARVARPRGLANLILGPLREDQGVDDGFR